MYLPWVSVPLLFLHEQGSHAPFLQKQQHYLSIVLYDEISFKYILNIL